MILATINAKDRATEENNAQEQAEQARIAQEQAEQQRIAQEEAEWEAELQRKARQADSGIGLDNILLGALKGYVAYENQKADIETQIAAQQAIQAEQDRQQAAERQRQQQAAQQRKQQRQQAEQQRQIAAQQREQERLAAEQQQLAAQQRQQQQAAQQHEQERLAAEQQQQLAELQRQRQQLAAQQRQQAERQRQQQQSSKQDLYGAIAFSKTATGDYATDIAWDYGNLQNAQQRAINECRQRGGQQCRPIQWFRNACGALATSDSGYGAGWGVSISEAWQVAVNTCRQHSQNCVACCHIYFSRCVNVINYLNITIGSVKLGYTRIR